MKFGKVLRQLRGQEQIGIKKLAPELGVTYSYLSKLENEEVNPSEDFVKRVATYFSYDQSDLLLSAGKVPEDVLEILRSHPTEAVKLLRARFGKK